jgi:acyl transferase domain-containing protein/NAD(P)H-dependent flavin oxidoreductase YrpB (nitropropane dioxygenase family)
MAVQAGQGGGRGVVDLGQGGWRSLWALAQASSRSGGQVGIRVAAGCEATPADVRRAAGGPIGLAVLTADSLWDPGEVASWSRVLVEVTSVAEARHAAAAGAHGLIARGMESGGRVSELSTFVLLQQLLTATDVGLPVWAAGGIGLRAAVACVAGGAAGVVLDSQFGLMPESDLPDDVMNVLRRLDGSETVAVPGMRGIAVTGSPLRLAGRRDADTALLPVGQDGYLAASFAARWPDSAAAVRAIRSAIVAEVRDDGSPHPMAEGARLAEDLGLRVPVAQGPMTRVSDQAGFAAAVAEDGALPFIALALADGARSRQMLTAAAAALRGRPWGVGVLGFVPDELRAAQYEAILEVKPGCAIIAGGRPAQARELEQAGIATFLHVPSPGLLRQFLGSGMRRFVFEGAECGGHIGPRSSFTLWEAQIAVIDEFLDEIPAGEHERLQLLFAGGVHDARSAAMVAAMTASLTHRGVRVGVLMGTAYLFTREAVEHGAIKPPFQRFAVDATQTSLLETSPGHVTRCLDTAYVGEFVAKRAELTAAGMADREIWAQLELLNTGRLRLASKGLEHDGTEVDEATQASEGLYMAGQVAVLREAVTTIPALHAEVTAGAGRFRQTRIDELRESLAIAADDATADERRGPLDIAVVGMAGMFAGSTDVDEFWHTVLSGKDMLTEVPAERWDPAIYYTPEVADTRPGRSTASKWGGFLRPVPIDPIRFGIPPNALGSIDPSQLLALEIADHALRDAGYPYDAPDADHARTGVIFATEPGSDDGAALMMRAMLPAYLGHVPDELDSQLPTFTEDTFPGHLANVVAGRIANRFNLGGTNFTVDAACAASLAALDGACKELAAGTADMMLCGAVDLHNSISDFLMFGSVYALSPKGRVATFDSAADGTALGEGVGCVVLKRLADAERDGDRIYAVIKGVGAASDGRARSLTAPRIDGQVLAMRRAYRQAGTSPGDVGLVEAHGTGTVLGDQTELESLTRVFTEAGTGAGSCVLGSVKSQIGHAKAAAGLAGLLKTALAVYYGVQPPTSNLTNPNSVWDPDTSPFAFLTEPRPWVAPAERRVASLSGFGFGGTNFHVVLSGHQAASEFRHALGDWPAELFCFRGADRPAAHRAVAGIADTLACDTGASLRAVAARAVREAATAAGEVQLAIVARDVTELATLLRRALAGEHDPAAGLVQPPPGGSTAKPPVAFLFPGQGSQRTGALAELFVAFPELRQYLEMGERWSGRLFPPAAFDPERERQQSDMLRDTRAAQPALGICGLAVSDLLGRLGVSPDMSGGHSYGELVALSVAGAFNPATLLDLSEQRASAILSAAGDDPGTMAAVNGSAAEVSASLARHGLVGDVTLANLNSPSQVVISGPSAAVDKAVAALRAAGLTTRRLAVACAFHSPVVAAASERFAECLATRPVAALQATVWSNRTAAPYPGDPDLTRAEMAAQISAPVRFADQVEAMYAAGARVFVEAGPGQVLTGLVGTILGERPHLAVACDGPRGQGLRGFLVALAQLACAGVPLNLSWLQRGRHTARSPLAAVNGHPSWTVDGQLIRDPNGAFLPGALTPPRLVKEFGVSSSSDSQVDPGTLLAEYLRTSREFVTAQRDVMLAFYGGQPTGRLVWQQAEAANGGVPLTATVTGTVMAEVPNASVPGATPSATATGPTSAVAEPAAPTLSDAAVQDTLLALISDRTGYPAELIDPGLDLEADLSIDSIKRAEIAGQLAIKLGLASEGSMDESVVEELVKARTVRAIIERISQKLAGMADAASAPTGNPGPSETTASPPETAQDGPAGTAPARLLSRRARISDTGEPSGSIATASLLITGESPVAELLASRLRERGADVRLSAREQISPDDMREAEGLIFLDGLSEGASAVPAAVFPLVKDCLNSKTVVSGQRWLLAAGRRDVPGAAGLAGLFRAVSTEYPHCFARYVELDGAEPADEAADTLLAELLNGAREPAVRYDGGLRHRDELVTAELAAGDGDALDVAAAAEAIGLNGDSVVVLIGGARGITARVASELATASRCRIELIGRTRLPCEPDPADIAAAPDAPAVRAVLVRQGMRIPAEVEQATRDILARREVNATIAELRELGSSTRYHCADARDEEAIHQILKQVIEDHGRIAGVIYAAGVIEDRLIADKDPESFTRVFQAKAGGAQVMLGALDEMQHAPGFVVLFGSIAAAFGSRGQADYAAANDALESIGAAWADRTGNRCVTVHWGPWAPSDGHPGMVTPELAREYERRGIGMIDPDEGALSLLRELAWGDPGVTSVTYCAGVLPDAG